MSVSQPVSEKITKVCQEVMKENKYLHHLMNSIAIGRTNSNGKFISNYVVDLFSLRTNAESRPDKYFFKSNFSIIQFSEFSLETFCRVVKTDYYTRNRINSNNNSVEYFRLFTPYKILFENKHSLSCGVNIFDNIKTRGSLINYNNVRQMIDEHSKVFSENITEIYYVGKKNSLLAFATPDGRLVIRFQSFKNIMTYNSPAIVKECVKNLFSAFDKLNEIFQKVNIRNFKDRIHPILVSKVYSQMMHNRDFSVADSSDLATTKKLEKKVVKWVKSYFETLVDGTSFGVHDRYSYKYLIENLVSNFKKREKEIAQESFDKGVSFGLKLEMIGWRPVDNCPISDSVDRTALWWKRDHEIIPEIFIRSDKKYKIPKKKRRWKITSLYLNMHGKMYAVGSHPNVSGNGKVCMGDLIIDFTKDETALKDMLDRAARLLEIINFDSAYDYAHFDDIEKDSEHMPAIDEGYTPTKTQMQSIRKLDLSSGGIDLTDDAEEIEIEEVEDNSISVSVDGENVARLIPSGELPQDQNSPHNDFEEEDLEEDLEEDPEEDFTVPERQQPIIDTLRNAVEDVRLNITDLWTAQTDADGSNITTETNYVLGDMNVTIRPEENSVFSLGDDNIIR